MARTRRAEPLVLRPEFLQFLRLSGNRGLQPGNLLAQTRHRVAATVDVGGVQEPLQSRHLRLQPAHVLRTLAPAKLLQLRTRCGKLLAVALENRSKAVEVAARTDRLLPPFLGTGFRFPELGLPVPRSAPRPPPHVHVPVRRGVPSPPQI